MSLFGFDKPCLDVNGDELVPMLSCGDVVSVEGQDYQITEFLGSGGWGQVFGARSDGHDYAIKISGRSSDTTDKIETAAREKLRAEADFYRRVFNKLSALGQSAVLKMYGINESFNNKCIIVMEKGSESILDRFRDQPMPLTEVQRMMRQLTPLLADFGKLKLVHGDIKPENILACDTQRGVLYKLIDFGAMCSVDDSRAGAGGTLWYKPPEVLFIPGSKHRVDIWQLACTAVELVKDVRRRDLCKAIIPAYDLRQAAWLMQTRFGSFPPGAKIGQIDANKVFRAIAFSGIPGNLDEYLQSYVDDLIGQRCFADFCDIIKKIFILNPDERCSCGDLRDSKFLQTDY